MRIFRPAIGAIVVLAACSSPPAPGMQGRVEAAPAASGPRALLELGEYLQARDALKSQLRARPDDREASVLLAQIESLAGIQGTPAEPEIRARIALFEVISHFSTGQGLYDRQAFRAAADHFERGLAEIEKFGLQNRFPRALRSHYEAQLRQARDRR
jgi:hypothetical protein